jgi:hypothetical protein
MDESLADRILNNENIKDKTALLKIQPANDCINEAKSKPIPKMLCGEFWHEGELCILFADTNLGKSILAVQIANLISKGQSDNVFKVEAVKQKVLYFDFELSPKQFEKRYSENYKNHYVWDSNLFRIEINPDCTAVIDFEGTLYSEIAKAVIEQEAKILIVDNITYLKGQSTDTAKEALPLMNMLNGLKKKYGLSILVLAHTPKINQSLPITVNHLAGSKQLSNFADSIFAIGLSNRGAQMRYIKQIKARATEKIYDSDNVIVCEIDKPGNFLGFNFIAFDNERTHLKEVSDTEQAETDSQIIELYKENTSLSARDIAKQLGTNHTRVLRLLKKNGLKG